MKKKVRYIVGAVGAVPAIGLVVPPTAMAATGAHVAVSKAGKTVSLLGRAAPPLVPRLRPGRRRPARLTTSIRRPRAPAST